MAGSTGVSTSPNDAIRVTHRVVASTVDSLYPLLGVKRLKAAADSAAAASIRGPLTAKASSNTSPASRTIRLRLQRTAPRVNAGSARRITLRQGARVIEDS